MRAPFVLLLAIAACGPVKSAKLVNEADVELEAARAAGAPKSAPYEFTSAEAYLHQARVEVGRANYEPAMEYAARARDRAREARLKAAGSRPEAR